MGTDEDLEATVTVGGKKYPLNYHEMEVQFEEIKQGIPSFTFKPMIFTCTWKISRKQQAMLNKLERKHKKHLKKILKIRRFKFAM